MNQSLKPRAQTNPCHRHIFENGMTLLLQENPSVDLVAGRIFLKNAGSRWEKREQAGLFNLLSRIITKGTEQYSALEIADKVESMGVSLSTDVTNDYFILSFKTVTSDFPEILELASEILHKPTFPESEIDLEKNLAIQSIRSQREQPFNVAYKELREAMYGLHPYALSILGQEETVRGLQGIDLKTTHQQHFRPDQLIISLSGNIELAKATSYVESIFGNWQNPATTLAELELATVPNQPQYKFIEQDTQQAVIMLGYFGASVYSQDYPVLKLLNTYLGNGLSSRLFVELREKRGLAYDVSAIYPTRIDLSQFILYIGTAPENTEIAKQGLQKEAERLVTTPLSQEELQSSKNKLLGQYALSKQTNAEVAQLNGWYETLGLGVEFDQEFNSLIQQITPELAQEVATKYLQQPYISLIGPVGLKNGG